MTLGRLSSPVYLVDFRANEPRAAAPCEAPRTAPRSRPGRHELRRRLDVYCRARAGPNSRQRGRAKSWHPVVPKQLPAFQRLGVTQAGLPQQLGACPARPPSRASPSATIRHPGRANSRFGAHLAARPAPPEAPSGGGAGYGGSEAWRRKLGETGTMAASCPGLKI